MFRLHQLPNNYPSYDSAWPLRKIELGRWIPKALSLEDFTFKQLYFVEKKLSGNKSIWKYYYKFLLPNNKGIHISPFSFYPKFEFYNGLKYSQNSTQLFLTLLKLRYKNQKRVVSQSN